jgi:aquaporin Z
MLVLIAVGVATLTFGFKLDGGSVSAGVIATALAFGLVLLALAYTLGPISGAHVNPAVTLGFVVSGRMKIPEAIGYWTAQFVGAIVGAPILSATVSSAPGRSTAHQGLGTDGWGPGVSMIGIGAAAGFAVEVVLTFAFVLVVLIATSSIANGGSAAMAIGFALTMVHLIGIPLTGTSVNPPVPWARR